MQCDKCGSNKLSISFLEETITIGKIIFRSVLPAKICTACGLSSFEIEMKSRFEKLVAVKLAMNGSVEPESFKFMRKIAGLSKAVLANVFDISIEIIDDWESSKTKIDWYYVALLGAIVLDKIQNNSTTTLDRLRAYRNLSIETDISIRTIEVV